MAEIAGPVTGGVDTHAGTHVAAVVDQVGRVLGTESFPAGADGYAGLLAWLRGHGVLVRVGVEGTGSSTVAADSDRRFRACGCCAERKEGDMQIVLFGAARRCCAYLAGMGRGGGEGGLQLMPACAATAQPGWRM